MIIMNWAQFKDLVSHLRLAGAVVACWFIIRKVGGSTHLFAKICFTDSVRFFTIHLGKTRLL